MIKAMTMMAMTIIAAMNKVVYAIAIQKKLQLSAPVLVQRVFW
ncbi:hypothetical protein P5E35_14495 [Clostridium perfringens]|nr:hypothetical protein [Clostridium perfringens]